jgi:DNA invertase Pin-like site-specific DNA recombinase
MITHPGAASAYLRVSSRAQDLAMQKLAIERTAIVRGDNVANWYSEKRSAKTIARPELNRLRDDARAGRVRRLYLYRLDRLARSGIRDTFEVVEELRRHGVELVTVSDGFDLNGPAAEVVLAVMAWAAKMERLAINERISAARERLESEGRPWGRPTRLVAADLERIRAYRTEGRSLRQISVAMKVPLATVARAIRREQAPNRT